MQNKNELLKATMTLSMGLLLLFSLAPHVLTGFWWIDLLSHFKPYYLTAFLILGIISLVFARQKYLLFLVIFGVFFNLAFIFPYLPDGKKSETGQLKLITLNLLSSNQETDKVLTFLREENADFVILLEYNERWARALEGVLDSYAYDLEIPRTDNFGLAVMSKYEMNNRMFEPKYLPPTILLRGNVKGYPLTIVATHPVPPVGSYRFQLRNSQFHWLFNEFKRYREGLIIAGDLNTSPYSPWFRRFLGDLSQLRDAREGYGYFATWPARFGSLGVAMDHVLMSKDLEVASISTGKNIGSDHLPVIVTFDLPAE